MLGVNHLSGFGAQRDSHELISIITKMGLSSDCKLCLDASDALSYTSGQTWTDRSGNGNNYFVGATNAVEATDYAFVGTAGTPDAYFQFDGGDYGVATGAQTFDAAYHQAGGAFTFAFLYRPISGKVGTTCLWSNRATGAANAGIMCNIDGSNMKTFLRRSTTTGASTNATSTALISGENWNFLSYGWSDASALVRMQLNSTHESQVSTQSTDTDAVSGIRQVAASNGATFTLEAGERLAGVMAFSKLLSEAELTTLRSLIVSSRPGYV